MFTDKIKAGPSSFPSERDTAFLMNSLRCVLPNTKDKPTASEYEILSEAVCFILNFNQEILIGRPVPEDNQTEKTKSSKRNKISEFYSSLKYLLPTIKDQKRVERHTILAEAIYFINLLLQQGTKGAITEVNIWESLKELIVQANLSAHITF